MWFFWSCAQSIYCWGRIWSDFSPNFRCLLPVEFQVFISLFSDLHNRRLCDNQCVYVYIHIATSLGWDVYRGKCFLSTDAIAEITLEFVRLIFAFPMNSPTNDTYIHQWYIKHHTDTIVIAFRRGIYFILLLSIISFPSCLSSMKSSSTNS